MDKLFDKENVISWSNRNEVKLGDEGYFGYSLQDLEREIKDKRLRKLWGIDEDSSYPFKTDEFRSWAWYAFFLPLNKVKKPIYRQLKNIDELFRFLTPDFEIRNNEKSNRYKKVETLLRRKITIRRKEDNFIKVMVITDIYFYDDDNNDIYLNGDSLKYLFCKYEILRNGEWQPFGIKVEEQDSESSKDKDNSLSDFMDKRIKEISEE